MKNFLTLFSAFALLNAPIFADENINLLTLNDHPIKLYSISEILTTKDGQYLAIETNSGQVIYPEEITGITNNVGKYRPINLDFGNFPAELLNNKEFESKLKYVDGDGSGGG